MTSTVDDEPSAGPPSTPARWERTRSGVFLALSSLIAVIGSERIYWYWAGDGWDVNLALVGFYLIPVSVAGWFAARSGRADLSTAVVVGSVYAVVAEGVLTPVIYEDGPLPLLALMFVGWHGLISVVGLWWLTHRWLVERRSLLLGVSAAGLGVWWGAWAGASAIAAAPSAADVAEMNHDPTVLSPGEFARYALTVTGVLAAGHFGLGALGPVTWRPGRLATVVVFGAAGAYFALAVLPVVVWAPAKIVALLWLATVWFRRLGREPNRAGLLDEMGGRVRFRDLGPLAALPMLATGTYWLLSSGWAQGGLVSLYWSMVTVQVAFGAVALWMAGFAGRTQRR
jgi:hypothetical protein